MEDNFGKAIEDNRNYQNDIDKTQTDIDDLQRIIIRLFDKCRTSLITNESKTLNYVNLEDCCLTKQGNPGF